MSSVKETTKKLERAVPLLADKNNPAGWVMHTSVEFWHDSRRLVQRCTKPDVKEFQKILFSCGIGFLIMGAIGYMVKLTFIPINNIIMG